MAWFVVEQSGGRVFERRGRGETGGRGRKCLLTNPEFKVKSRQENSRGGRVRTKCKGRLAGDRPARRRWQGNAALEIRINSLKCGQVRYDGRIDGKGVRGTVSEIQ